MLLSYFLKFSANLFKGGYLHPQMEHLLNVNHLCIIHHFRHTSTFLEAVMDVLTLFLLHDNLQPRFNPRLYGSQSCHAQVTHCQLVLGAQAQLRCIDKDAPSCYNCIIVGLLRSNAGGLEVHEDTLQFMQYSTFKHHMACQKRPIMAPSSLISLVKFKAERHCQLFFCLRSSTQLTSRVQILRQNLSGHTLALSST
jgi:hypothetical protein